MFSKYILVLILAGTVFLAGCSQENKTVPVQNQTKTTIVSPVVQNSENSFLRNIVFSQYVSSSGTVNSIFLDRDNKYGNGLNTIESFDSTTRTNKAIIQTTKDAISLETLESPDKKSIVFMVHTDVPLSIKVNTPEDHGPYAGAELKSVFSYDVESDMVTDLFNSKRTQGEGFCFHSFSPDIKALILSCGSSMGGPDGTYGFTNVYSFVSKKLYELGEVWRIEWLKDGRFRYKELKDEACNATDYYICHPESECEVCYRDISEMPWKYIQYK